MNRRRHAYALVELLVVLTVVALMLALCAGTIRLLLKLDRSNRDASETAGDLARLARDFRADAHACTTPAPLAEGADRMTLPLDGGGAVEYQARPLDILRTLRDGEKVRRLETYRRPARTSARFRVDREGPRPFAILTLDRPPDGRDETSAYRDLRIEAELGKDRRLNPRAE